MQEKFTQAYLRQIFDYNPDTGSLTWKISPKYDVRIGDEVGRRPGRRDIGIQGRLYQRGVIIWMWYYGYWPKGKPYEVVDHIDNNQANNRINNLRLATMQQNAINNTGYSSNTSGYTGVSRHKHTGKYMAYISVNKKIIYLGVFSTIEEAVEARKQAEIKYRA